MNLPVQLNLIHSNNEVYNQFDWFWTSILCKRYTCIVNELKTIRAYAGMRTVYMLSNNQYIKSFFDGIDIIQNGEQNTFEEYKTVI